MEGSVESLSFCSTDSFTQLASRIVPGPLLNDCDFDGFSLFGTDFDGTDCMSADGCNNSEVGKSYSSGQMQVHFRSKKRIIASESPATTNESCDDMDFSHVGQNELTKVTGKRVRQTSGGAVTALNNINKKTVETQRNTKRAAPSFTPNYTDNDTTVAANSRTSSPIVHAIAGSISIASTASTFKVPYKMKGARWEDELKQNKMMEKVSRMCTARVLLLLLLHIYLYDST